MGPVVKVPVIAKWFLGHSPVRTGMQGDSSHSHEVIALLGVVDSSGVHFSQPSSVQLCLGILKYFGALLAGILHPDSSINESHKDFTWQNSLQASPLPRQLPTRQQTRQPAWLQCTF